MRSVYLACLWPLDGEPDVSVADVVFCKAYEQRSCLSRSHLQCPCIEGDQPVKDPARVFGCMMKLLASQLLQLAKQQCRLLATSCASPTSPPPCCLILSARAFYLRSCSASPCTEVHWATSGPKCLRRRFLACRWRARYFSGGCCALQRL